LTPIVAVFQLYPGVTINICLISTICCELEMYSIQHYVIKFTRDLGKAGFLSQVTFLNLQYLKGCI